MIIGEQTSESVRSSPDVLSIVRVAVTAHGATREELIPILSEINQAVGYIPAEAVVEASRLLRIPQSEIFAVASFYRMFSTRPRGKHVIQFCESAPCHVVGARRVWEALQARLGVAPGGTTADGQWTLITTSCLGLCSVGPVIVIDDDVYGNVEAEQVTEILARYEGAKS